MNFFAPMKIPTTTFQMMQVRMNKKTGKPIFYQPAAVKEAKSRMAANLARHSKGIPMHGSLQVTVKWLFPCTKNHKDGEYKRTKPDLDNLSKLLLDVMTDLDFWIDDAQIASLITEKFYSDNPGIFIEIQQLEVENVKN